MTDYYVDRDEQENGDHEIHTVDCYFLPSAENRLYLGNFTRAQDALLTAKKYYLTSNGCIHCSPECHTTQ